ncbi:CaiB/BaiF CoA-transferase family protein, partial [Streptomyces sp. NPDC006356]
VTSGLYAALSVMALLYGKGRGGPTSSVAVSLFDTMTELMGYPLTYTRHSGVEQQPLGMSSPAVSPYGAYRTGDGQTVVLGTTNDAEWQRLATELLGRPDLADDARFRSNAGRVAHRALLDSEIAAWCSLHDLAHVQERADAAGIGNARYNTQRDVLAHPHLAARDRWREIDTPSGPVPALLPPPVIAGVEPPMGAVPALGEHTDAVLAELGFPEAEIAELRAQEAIG